MAKSAPKAVKHTANVFFMILLVCVIAEKILPPWGKFALLDAGLGTFYGLLLPPAFLGVMTYFTFHTIPFLNHIHGLESTSYGCVGLFASIKTNKFAFMHRNARMECIDFILDCLWQSHSA